MAILPITATAFDKASAEFRRSLARELADRGFPLRRLAEGLAWRDSAGRLRWMHVLNLGGGLVRVAFNFVTIRPSVARGLQASIPIDRKLRGEITLVIEELQHIVDPIAEVADSSVHSLRLPSAEARFWGRDYRWSLEGWFVYCDARRAI